MLGAAAASAGASVALRAAGAAPTEPLVLDDASRLNQVRVKRHLRPPARDTALHERLRKELQSAAAEGRPVCVGGARHSMGGQSLAAGGTAITLDRGWIEPDVRTSSYRAAAGARWRDIVPMLDPIGFAPKVTQSNNDFTLGGTFSVNAHGWAAPLGPMGSTVRAVTLMLANGEIVRCSRTVEPQLFRHAMGGYGLMGVLLDLDVEMTRNVRLKPSFQLTPANDFGPLFASAVRKSGVRMGYGRLSIDRDAFLTEALMITYREQPGSPARLAANSRDPLDGVTRRIYRAQTGSDAWKAFRWTAETRIAPRLQGGVVTRNALLNTPVSALAASDRTRTDILHEYFLPARQLSGFLADCRDILARSPAELLNVTLRYVAADSGSTLTFAPDDRVAAVMSFSQPASIEADRRMRPVTQALIDAALQRGGSFYLPYRLQARHDQLTRAYPAISDFVRFKREVDPNLLFRNTMWDAYFAAGGPLA